MRHGSTRLHMNSTDPAGNSLIDRLTSHAPSQTVTNRGPQVIQIGSGQTALESLSHSSADQLPTQSPTANGPVRDVQPSNRSLSYSDGQVRSIGST